MYVGRGKRLTQAAFAERVGVSQSRVSDWLADKQLPDGRHMVEIPKVLGVSGHWLLLGEGNSSPPSTAPDVELARLEGYLLAVARFRDALHEIAAHAPAGSDDDANEMMQST